jgi:hypothetical protein
MLTLRTHWCVGSCRRRRGRSGSYASSGLATLSVCGSWSDGGDSLRSRPRTRHAKSDPCIIPMGKAPLGLVGSCGQANGGVGRAFPEHPM